MSVKTFDIILGKTSYLYHKIRTIIKEPKNTLCVMR